MNSIIKIIQITPQQFKIGDWVRHKHLHSIHLCTDINYGEFDNKISTKPALNFSSEFMDEYELWQPKEGEWVYSIKDTDLFEVYRYKHYTNPRQCQPFIGALPTFLKDK